MNKLQKLKKKHKQKSSLKKTTSEKVPVKLLMHHLNSPISIFDSRKRRYIYVNPQFVQLTGLSTEELYKIDLDEFLKRIHAKDLLVVLNEVAKRVRDTSSQYIKNKKQQLTYTLNYRFKQKEDKYIHVMVQNTVMEWDEDNKRSVTLNLYTDISNHKKDHKIILTINIFNESVQQWETVLTEEFLSTPEMLSEREREIMKMIVSENAAGEISEKLGLKFYTVRAHWRNILNKTGCKSQKELKELAQREGWV